MGRNILQLVELHKLMETLNGGAMQDSLAGKVHGTVVPQPL